MPPGRRGRDEVPGADKPLESVIEAHSDLIEVIARLRTPTCVKGQPALS